MSYCRFSSPIPELTPNVDLSLEKMIEYISSGGYKNWKKYLHDNNIKTSDFYVYEHVHGGFVCHCAKKNDVSFETAKEMVDYLQECKNNDELVPQSAIDSLIEEQTMAGIEKVCEALKGGHWYGVDTFLPWGKDGKSIYRNNIQVCLEHRKKLKEKFKDKYHEIVITKNYSSDMFEFQLKVDGVPCPYDNKEIWSRWFWDRRAWKNNMKQLLSVKKLNIVNKFSF